MSFLYLPTLLVSYILEHVQRVHYSPSQLRIQRNHYSTVSGPTPWKTWVENPGPTGDGVVGVYPSIRSRSRPGQSKLGDKAGITRRALMAISTQLFSLSSASPRIEIRAGNPRGVSCSVPAQVTSLMQKDSRGRRVWRRRKLTKKDDMLRCQVERVPFLEEQVRKIQETGKVMSMDIERLLLSEDNRYDFVNDVAAEAIEYVENNRDEYGGKKKAILQVLSNRINDIGFYRPEAYEEFDPYRPGPEYMKEEFT